MIMFEALPPQPSKKKLMEEADKRNFHGALMLEGVPSDTVEKDVAVMVDEYTGARPRSVEKKGRKFRIVP